jgi:hypothetical protein
MGRKRAKAQTPKSGEAGDRSGEFYGGWKRVWTNFTRLAGVVQVLEKGAIMYIGVGAIVLVLLVILVVMALRGRAV